MRGVPCRSSPRICPHKRSRALAFTRQQPCSRRRPTIDRRQRELMMKALRIASPAPTTRQGFGAKAGCLRDRRGHAHGRRACAEDPEMGGRALGAFPSLQADAEGLPSQHERMPSQTRAVKLHTSLQQAACRATCSWRSIEPIRYGFRYSVPLYATLVWCDGPAPMPICTLLIST